MVAVHKYMLFDQLLMVFLHSCGRGSAAQLAAGSRTAVRQLGQAPAPAHGGMKH